MSYSISWMITEPIDVIKADDKELWVYRRGVDEGAALSLTPMGTILVNDRQMDMGADLDAYRNIFKEVADKYLYSVYTLIDGKIVE